VSEAAIDEAVRRLLSDKFELGCLRILCGCRPRRTNFRFRSDRALALDARAGDRPASESWRFVASQADRCAA